jgi:anti-anti-sigma factor
MKVTVHEELQNFIIKPYGRFEDGDYQVLNDVLDKVAKSQSRHVFVDLNELHNITTAGQRLLLSYASKLEALQRLLVLYNVNGRVMEAFETSGLAKVIFIAPGLNEAKNLVLSRK